MPRATYNPDKTERFDLESLEGGYVVLRKMSYGQRVQVREMAMQLSMVAKTEELGIEMTQMRVDEFEFKTSIVEHNLEDEAGNVLNFAKAGTVGSLDPEVGTEISQLITKFNNPDTDPKDG